MYVFTNAFRNLWRNRGRNALIGGAIAVILSVVIVTLVIRSATGSIIDDYTSRFGAQVYLTPDFAKAMSGDGGAVPTLTLDQQKRIARSPHVKSYVATVTDSMNTKDVTAVDQNATPAPGVIKKQVGGGANEPVPNVRVIGTTDLSSLDKFDRRTRTIVEGRAPHRRGDALVSREFAKLNHLAVGDTFHGTGADRSDPLVYALTVSGIYADAGPAYPEGFPTTEAFLNNRNEVITTFDTVMSNYAARNYAPPTSVTYTLHTPGELDAFKKDVAAAGVDVGDFAFSTDLAKYNKIVKPVEGMRSIASLFLIVVLILGAGILILISMMAVRERTYEVGVLRAMGMRTSRVLTGFITESVALALLALVIAVPLAVLVSSPVADGMLAAQNDAYASSADAQNDQRAQDPSSGFVVVSPEGADDTRPTAEGGLGHVDLRPGPDTLVELAGVTLGLAAAASVLGIIMICRFEPITILADRK